MENLLEFERYASVSGFGDTGPYRLRRSPVR